MDHLTTVEARSCRTSTSLPYDTEVGLQRWAKQRQMILRTSQFHRLDAKKLSEDWSERTEVFNARAQQPCAAMKELDWPFKGEKRALRRILWSE